MLFTVYASENDNEKPLPVKFVGGYWTLDYCNSEPTPIEAWNLGNALQVLVRTHGVNTFTVNKYPTTG